ncbi:MAG: hypothetical protein K8L91_08645 [Anaerolineae bacterium]|nr:hypothetical protein [Anaerolineae bacterium]
MKAHIAGYNVHRVGFYSAILTSVLTVITFIAALTAIPISGANCRKDCIEYPYLEIESRFPRDYWWMFLAIGLMVVYVVLMVSIHQYAPAEKKIYSQIGLIFALMAALILIVDYFVQVTVIQASIKNGETEGITLLTQYNPHGIFIALEELGYLVMSLAFMCFAPVFGRANRLERAVRWLFIGDFGIVIVALILMVMAYGVDREDRFEVVAISVNWLVLIVGGGLLSRVFRRAMAQ